MKILKIPLIGFGIVIALPTATFVAAVLIIPANRSFTNEIDINAPAESVWNVVNDRSRYTEWQTNLTRVEVIDDRHWIEYPKDSPDPLKFEQVVDERPTTMTFQYTIGNAFAGKWTGTMTPKVLGVHLVTIDRYTTRGWFTKILVYLFFDYGKFAKDWNQKLKVRAEQRP
jgi:hypothetical protein